jgi:hypothetical protein
MQTVHRDAYVAPVPRIYRNRPSSPTFNTPRQEQLCDVIYLVDADSDAREEMLAFLAALDMKVISFESSREYLQFR